MKHPILLRLLPTFASVTLLSINTHGAPGDLYAIKATVIPDLENIVKFTPAGAESAFATGLNLAQGIAFDRLGNLFVATANDILRFTPDGAQTTFASSVRAAGLAFDRSGNLFAAEPDNHDILKFTPTGVRSTFASGLTTPFALAFDLEGNLFVADRGIGAILKFTLAGAKSTFATGLSDPSGLAFDRSGNVFVTDAGAGAILKFTPGGAKSTFVSGLDRHVGPAFDGSGNLFVSTFFNLVKLAPSGRGTSFADGMYGFLAFEPVLEKLRNLSARGLVGTGENVLIGGFILGGNALANNSVLARAIGPSLSPRGVSNPLPDPVLELHNSDGALIARNNDWQDTQAAQITATGLAPTDPRESAIFATLPQGNFTAIVRGAGSSTGVALVEVYSTQ